MPVTLDNDNYRNNIKKSITVVKDIQGSLKISSIGYISIQNILDYIEFLENKLKKEKLTKVSV